MSDTVTPNENQIEKELIGILTHKENQWTYRPDIKSEAALWDNLRQHVNRINLARLDGKQLSDKEFECFRTEFARLTASPFEASRWLRGENGIASIQIERDDANKKASLVVFSNKDIAGGISSYEAVNQIKPDSDKDLRGDVTLLINGLPVIHIELKAEYAKNGYHQAFDQIVRYAEQGFFNGIYATPQIFVVSNKVATRYFARPQANTAKSFELAKKFLFNWRDSENNPVESLYDFTREVLRIPMAHELVSRLTILVDDKRSQKFLMALRPYQIHAIKKLMSQASKHEGGFIWHATGSGKTVTSFVATKLLARTVGVDRTIMVVDRTDLDNQTNIEFSKFASEYQTGQSSGNVTDNTLIVGVGSSRELSKALLSEKNDNTIIVTTIQKLSAAIRSAKKFDENRFEKLRGEHIALIVDEAHRAVSDKEMKEIKKFLPNSTWFGLTGTPIFEENKKQEDGTHARTTQQQYGDLLHAYTTKNAIDDGSVLAFQVEYHCLLNEDRKIEYLHRRIKEKNPEVDAREMLTNMTEIEKERLLDKGLFEQDEYIDALLEKIFKRQSVAEKFSVENGFPTMSAILTTSSIAQAKRIYKRLQELKSSGNLLNGRVIDERDELRDGDFPRVAITYSLSDNQADMNKDAVEIEAIMQEYNNQFGTKHTDIDRLNESINNRLARKDVQYQKDGKWLDLVIVVDRLLTGFDAPTVQTLYVDRELRYQKLLQAFSRTNRTYPRKKTGMIVTFRKPHTMRENVEAAIKLFSNEAQNWEELVPRDYSEVKDDFVLAYNEFVQAKEGLLKDPSNLKKKIVQVRAFQRLEKLQATIKSYEDYADDYKELSKVVETIRAERGHSRNLEAEIRDEHGRESSDELDDLLQYIEYTPKQRAFYEDRIDSYFIAQLLEKYQCTVEQYKNPEDGAEIQELRKKLIKEIDAKPSPIRDVYKQILYDIEVKKMTKTKDEYFAEQIEVIIREMADKLMVPPTTLQTSFNEFSATSDVPPFINAIVKSSGLNTSRELFEQTFNDKFRNRSLVIERLWKETLENRLVPLREEMYS